MSELTGLIVPDAPLTSFGSMLSWGYTDNGVTIRDEADDSLICEFATRYPSRDGVRVIDAIRKSSPGFRVQVSDHGCGRKSVLVINHNNTIAADVNVGE